MAGLDFMTKEQGFSYMLVAALSLIGLALVLLYVITPILEYFLEGGDPEKGINRPFDPGDIEDATMPIAFGLVGLAVCILLALPK